MLQYSWIYITSRISQHTFVSASTVGSRFSLESVWREYELAAIGEVFPVSSMDDAFLETTSKRPVGRRLWFADLFLFADTGSQPSGEVWKYDVLIQKDGASLASATDSDGVEE